MRHEPRIRESIDLLQRLWVEAGGDPTHLAHVKPIDAGLSYDVVLRDGRAVRIRREMIDDREYESLRMRISSLIQSQIK